MKEVANIAVAPPIQVGGSLFTAEQLSKIGVIAGSEAKIEMTPFKQPTLAAYPTEESIVAMGTTAGAYISKDNGRTFDVFLFRTSDYCERFYRTGGALDWY